MSGSISFSGIPASIRVPGTYVEISNERAVRGLAEWPARVAIFGLRLSTGTVAAATPVRVTSPSQARTFFGRGSQLAATFEAWFANAPFVETWGVGVDEPGAGAAATGTINFSGPATAAGVAPLLIAGRRVEASVASGAAVAAVAQSVRDAVNAQPDLPVTATSAGGIVTLTARSRGGLGNQIPIRVAFYPGEALPAGLTAVVTQMAGGAGTPAIQAAIDALGDAWFTDIVWPWTAAVDIAVLEARLTSQFQPLQMRDANGWCAIAGDFAALTTYGGARNSPHVVNVGVRGSPTPAYEWAAAFAAANIPALAIDPARPTQTLPVLGVVPPALADRWSWTEADQLLRTGIATTRTNVAGQTTVERAITSYLTGPGGAPDVSYLDVETLKTLAFLRFDLRTAFRNTFPRHKLADDGNTFAEGQKVMTPGLGRAFIVGRASQWRDVALIENLDQFKRDLIVRRNATDRNRLDALVPPDIVNQFRVLAAQIEFIL